MTVCVVVVVVVSTVMTMSVVVTVSEWFVTVVVVIVRVPVVVVHGTNGVIERYGTHDVALCRYGSVDRNGAGVCISRGRCSGGCHCDC